MQSGEDSKVEAWLGPVDGIGHWSNAQLPLVHTVSNYLLLVTCIKKKLRVAQKLYTYVHWFKESSQVETLQRVVSRERLNVTVNKNTCTYFGTDGNLYSYVAMSQRCR